MPLHLSARLAAALLTLSPLAASAAGDAAEGRKVSRMCSACHGKDGVAVRPHTPNIAGQDADYLVEQLKHFRSGERKHEEMNVVARPLTDVQIANVAAWFATQATAAD